jgi:hypothetical protein
MSCYTHSVVCSSPAQNSKGQALCKSKQHSKPTICQEINRNWGAVTQGQQPLTRGPDMLDHARSMLDQQHTYRDGSVAELSRVRVKEPDLPIGSVHGRLQLTPLLLHLLQAALNRHPLCCSSVDLLLLLLQGRLKL